MCLIHCYTLHLLQGITPQLPHNVDEACSVLARSSNAYLMMQHIVSDRRLGIRRSSHNFSKQDTDSAAVTHSAKQKRKVPITA
jgi:hypothetical protein